MYSLFICPVQATVDDSARFRPSGQREEFARLDVAIFGGIWFFALRIWDWEFFDPLGIFALLKISRSRERFQMTFDHEDSVDTAAKIVLNQQGAGTVQALGWFPTASEVIHFSLRLGVWSSFFFCIAALFRHSVGHLSMGPSERCRGCWRSRATSQAHAPWHGF